MTLVGSSGFNFEVFVSFQSAFLSLLAHPSRKMFIIFRGEGYLHIIKFHGFIGRSELLEIENFWVLMLVNLYQLNFGVITAVQLPYFLSIFLRIIEPKMLRKD